MILILHRQALLPHDAIAERGITTWPYNGCDHTKAADENIGQYLGIQKIIYIFAI